ncbi:MAG: DsbA family protein [Nanoarchaeota archaeon]|nr:DsbA family protein [Nanoarchaeota archaeon]
MKKKISTWKILTAVFAILLVASVATNGFKSMGGLSKESAKQTANDFIQTNLVSPGVSIDIESITEKNGLYLLDVAVTAEGTTQNVESYISKDGKLFFPQALDMEAIIPTAPQQPTTAPTIVEASVDDDAVKGDANAPVTIIEFSDFQCPFCAKFYTDTLPQITEEYIDTGKVKFIYRDFPLGFHQNAQKAAEAAECAGDQDMFWEMHDMLYENQNALTVADLKQYASDLDLDATEFDECLDSGKYEDEVKDDMAEGSSYGVSGTPAFFINGQLLSGAQPFAAFQAVIEAELANL